ncbi:MAG: YitT family protein [Clostridia bacterium]|nr:YitT family protein [Clostridia bacterium]
MKRYITITASCLLYAIAVALCLEPHALAAGGASGLAILLTNLIPINTGILIFLINFPLLILGTWKLGKGFAAGTIYATVISSVMIAMIHNMHFPLAIHDPFLSAVAGGILQAAGLGIVFRNGATTGGTDVVVSLITYRYKKLRTGIAFLIIDSGIITASWLITGDTESTVCAAVALTVCSLLMDIFIVSGKKNKKNDHTVGNKIS